MGVADDEHHRRVTEAKAQDRGAAKAAPRHLGAALLAQLHSDWSPEDVKSALLTSAKRPVLDHVNGTDPTGVLTRGGGRVDLDAANGVTVLNTPSSVSFGLFKGNKAANGSVALTLRSATGSSQLCSASVTGSPKVSLSATSFSVTASGTTLTAMFNGGNADQTGSGDLSGDIVLTCGVEHNLPWWTRVDRSGKS